MAEKRFKPKSYKKKFKDRKDDPIEDKIVQVNRVSGVKENRKV